MLRFQYANYLGAFVLLPLLVALFVAMIYWRRKKIAKFDNPQIAQQQLLGFIPARTTLKFVLQSIALAAIILGVANLQKVGNAETIQRKGIDVIVALDVSKSMLATDIQPDRLTRAKQFIERLSDKMSNNRIGLVIFAGRSYLQVPLTVDYSALKLLLQTVSPDMVPTQGTVISEAIDLANSSFSNKEKKYKSIVLISDGEDHEEAAISAVEKAAENGVIVHTVGIGSPNGASLYDPQTNAQKLDEQGNPVISKLNESELKSIAAAGNGSYTLLSNTDAAASKIVEELDTMEQRNLGAMVYNNYTSYFQYFLLLALLLLIIEWIIPNSKRSQNNKFFSLPINKSLAALLLIPLALACTDVSAQSSKKLIAKGNQLYKEGNYKEAAEQYSKSLQVDTANISKGAYNLGNALYQQKNNEGARKAYEATAKKSNQKEENARANYNIGNTYMSEKKWAEAVESFKSSLRKNPQDADAKYNLAYAQAMLKKDGGGKDKDKKDKEQDKKDQDKKDQDKKDQDKKDKGEDKKEQEPDKGDKEKQDEGKPQPQPSKLSEKQAEQLLDALQQEEKKLQEKNKKKHGSPVKLEKDW